MPVQASANKHHDRVPSTCTHPSDIQCKEKAVPKQKSSAKSSGPQKPELLIHVCGPTRAFWHWCFSCPVPFLELAKVLNGMFLFWWPETAAVYLFSPILFSGEKTSNSAAADRGFQPFPAKRLADSRSTRVTLGPLEFANFLEQDEGWIPGLTKRICSLVRVFCLFFGLNPPHDAWPFSIQHPN